MDYPMKLYPIELENGKVEWCVEFTDLPECVGGGDTCDEAVADALETKRIFLKLLEEEGMEIPKPSKIQDLPSGKIALRIPKSTHKIISEYAKEDGVSINSYINNAISEKIGRDSALKNIRNFTFNFLNSFFSAFQLKNFKSPSDKFTFEESNDIGVNSNHTENKSVLYSREGTFVA